MTSNSENEEHDIPSHILKTLFGLHASGYFLDPNMCGFQYILWSCDPSGQLAEITVYITSTRVDLYSHQILFAYSIVVTEAEHK